jgi:hypothetical protein
VPDGIEVTPLDQSTKLPLPILPPEELPSSFRPRNGYEDHNWHHHFHPCNDPLLKSTDGLVIRNARLQFVNIALHNEYHNNFLGPELPDDGYERFKASVWASAGYIPEEAISFSGDSPERVALSSELRFRMQQSGELRIATHDSMRKFMKRFISKQDLSHLKEGIIEEFMLTSDDERAKELGQLLLAKAVEVASEPFNPAYTEAKRKGLILPSITSKLSQFILNNLGNLNQRNCLAKQLRERQDWPLSVYKPAQAYQIGQVALGR